MSDELAEAERRARLLRETDGAHYVGLPPILDELVRLRAVEKAAAALVEQRDAAKRELCCPGDNGWGTCGTECAELLARYHTLVDVCDALNGGTT